MTHKQWVVIVLNLILWNFIHFNSWTQEFLAVVNYHDNMWEESEVETDSCSKHSSCWSFSDVAYWVDYSAYHPGCSEDGWVDWHEYTIEKNQNIYPIHILQRILVYPLNQIKSFCNILPINSPISIQIWVLNAMLLPGLHHIILHVLIHEFTQH